MDSFDQMMAALNGVEQRMDDMIARRQAMIAKREEMKQKRKQIEAAINDQRVQLMVSGVARVTRSMQAQYEAYVASLEAQQAIMDASIAELDTMLQSMGVREGGARKAKKPAAKKATKKPAAKKSK